MATLHTKLPWRAMQSVLNSRRYYLYSDADLYRVASDLKRLDAEYILRVIADREHIKASNEELRKRLRASEATVKRLKAYVRSNEVKTLRGMKIVQQEPI
jgi:hypothetical protein